MSGRIDPHFNVFYAYRGGAPDDRARQRQLEDNLTRALGIVLRHLGTEAAPLLEALGVEESLRDKPFDVRFQVKSPSEDWPAPGSRKLMAIVAGGTPTKSDAPATRDSAKEDARSDMVLLWTDAALVVESELKQREEAEQMERLRATFSTAPWEGKTKTWTDVAKAVRRMNGARQRALTNQREFLLHELEEYLRMNGFGGFIKEHFAYFSLDPADRKDEPVIKEGARRALEECLAELLQRWGVGCDGADWDIAVGNLNDGDRTLWGKLQPNNNAAAAQLSAEISNDGFNLFWNVELQQPFKKFVRAWKERPQEFLQLLGSLKPGGSDEKPVPGPWALVIKRRLQDRDENTGNIKPRKFTYLPTFSVGASTAVKAPQAVEGVIRAAVAFAASEPAPEIMVLRHYEVWEVVKDDFMEKLVADARQLEPFFAWFGQKVS